MNDMPASSRAFDLDAFRREVLSDPLVQNVWINKYRWRRPDGSVETSILESQERVVNAVYAKDPDQEARKAALWAVVNGYFLPAGRVNAGAGTGRNVTLMNCYVGGTMQDSMPGIQLAIAKDAFTLQQGGGVGDDFSTVRPAGAVVSRTGSVASGSIVFMDQRSAMSDTVCSAGERRGAMMTVLSCDHPDLWNEEQFETRTTYTGDKVLRNPSFISVKRQKNRLTQTNISVLVTDAFMKAVENDADWDLGFHVPRADGRHVDVYDKSFAYDVVEMDNDFAPVDRGSVPRKGEMRPWYVYTRVKARRIWHDIMQSTYRYAEPGVIFIDQVNRLNNLNYIEIISASNPCGEQPLPPYGCCCLGSVNLAFMVENPFTTRARFNTMLFRAAIDVGVRFLDNVLDVSGYPLREQHEESMAKRRIGLGLTGVADALAQMGVRYGSDEAQAMLSHWTCALQERSYFASSKLASERGSFPAYDRDRFMRSPNVYSLDRSVMDGLKEGMRNGVLNTVAPNGTISIYSGNTAQGIEPVFSFDKVVRKVRQPDGTLADYESVNYSYRLYEAIHGPTARKDMPDYFVGALEIPAREHVLMQAACQRYIDASISKTVNCPEDMTFEEFADIYKLAYDSRCKGCTTYRPDPESGRGSVLSVEPEEKIDTSDIPEADEDWFKRSKLKLPVDGPIARDRVMTGRTYKLKWPPTGANWYVTVNSDGERRPLEVFIVGGDGVQTEWVQAMGRLLTAVLRRGGDVRFLVGELLAVHSANAGGFVAEQHAYRASLVAAIGGILQEEFKTLGLYGVSAADAVQVSTHTHSPMHATIVPVTVTRGDGPDSCPSCGATPLVREQGCVRCLSCDFTKCG